MNGSPFSKFYVIFGLVVVLTPENDFSQTFHFKANRNTLLNTLTLKQILWKTNTFFKKLEYRFLVESTKIDDTSTSYKTTISEANVKTNRMVSIE